MTVAVFDAAKSICERGSWKVTNLALQKILYMAHMIYMGRTGERLVDASFEAWDYGPVIPALYKKVASFGDKPIRDIFFSAFPIPEGAENDTLKEACDHLLSKRPGELVALTHRPGGAWANHYRAGVRGVSIPDADIINEYRLRTGQI